MRNLDGLIYDLRNAAHFDHRTSLVVTEDLTDAIEYLEEYKKQKYIWKKLYQLFEKAFWGLEEEYPLDGEYIRNLCFDAYNEGFDDEDA